MPALIDGVRCVGVVLEKVENTLTENLEGNAHVAVEIEPVW